MATSIDDLMTQIPIDQLAGKLGLSEEETKAALNQALPALVSGMAANAQDPAGLSSLSKALGKHDNDLLDGGIDFDQVDTDDGQKIVKSVFGDNQDAVTQQLAGAQSFSGGSMAKLLPMLAPLVMTYLAKSAKGSGGGGGGGGGLGDILGGLLGGSGSGSGGGGGLGDILGGLLGGGKR